MIDIKSLSVAQKIGLVLCSRRVHLEEDYRTTVDMIHEHAVGCVQVRTDKDAGALIAKLKAEADYPILFINDMERGYPPAGLPPLPALTLAACGREEYLEDFARGIVAGAKADGFSGTWGPVLDLQVFNRPCSVSREFGSTPEAVLKCAEPIARVFAENRFLACGKHYPGEYDCLADTHMVEGKSRLTREQLLNGTLIPYLTLYRKGLLPSIMTSHTVFENIDPEYPASLSAKVIGIIREAGYDGLIFTDSLAMMGILQKYGEAHAMALALAAGNDIILPNYRTPHAECVRMMTEEYEKGSFTEAQLDAAVRRIFAAAEYVSSPTPKNDALTDKVRASCAAVPRDAVTAVADKGVSAMLPESEAPRLFIVLARQDFSEGSPKEEISLADEYDPRAVSEHIKALFPSADVAFMRELPTAAENERLLNKATGFGEIVFVTFCETSPYLGTDGLTRRAEAVINALIESGKVRALVHFGNPYAVEPLRHVPRLIFAYNAPESRNYALDVLAGRLEAKGRLPINVRIP